MKSKILRIVFVLVLLTTAAVQTAVGHPGDQHGDGSDHLLGTGAWGDIELVSVEDLTNTPGLVADVAISPDGTRIPPGR